jgi:hypothetical protein
MCYLNGYQQQFILDYDQWQRRHHFHPDEMERRFSLPAE